MMPSTDLPHTVTLSVRIVGAPMGEAPLWVREAWIGLVLPLTPNHHRGPVETIPGGVLTGDPSFWRKFKYLFRNPYKWYQGYCVSSCQALKLLALHSPPAWSWWQKNCPAYLGEGKYFMFDSHVSLLLDEGGNPIPPRPVIDAMDVPGNPPVDARN